MGTAIHVVWSEPSSAEQENLDHCSTSQAAAARKRAFATDMHPRHDPRAVWLCGSRSPSSANSVERWVMRGSKRRVDDKV